MLEANLGAAALLRAAASVRRLLAWIGAGAVFFAFALVVGLLGEDLGLG